MERILEDTIHMVDAERRAEKIVASTSISSREVPVSKEPAQDSDEVCVIFDPRTKIIPCSVLLDRNEVRQYCFLKPKKETQFYDTAVPEDPLSFASKKPKLEILDPYFEENIKLKQEVQESEFVDCSDIIKTECVDNIFKTEDFDIDQPYTIEEEPLIIKDEEMDVQQDLEESSSIHSVESVESVQCMIQITNEVALSESTLEILNMFESCVADSEPKKESTSSKCDQAKNTTSTPADSTTNIHKGSKETINLASVLKTLIPERSADIPPCTKILNADAHEKLNNHLLKAHFLPIFFPALSKHIKHNRFSNCMYSLRCCECDLDFSSRLDTKAHLLKKHKLNDETPFYRCSYCTYRVFNFQLLMDHLVEFHKHYLKDFLGLSKFYKCKFCMKEIRPLLKSDEAVKPITFVFNKFSLFRNINMNLCGKTQELFQIRVKFTEETPEETEVKTFCKLCNVDFLNEFEFNMHLDLHVESSFKKCNICCMNTSNISEYLEHVFRCHSTDVSVKDKCQISFEYLTNLTADNILSGFHCAFCTFSTFNMCKFNTHLVVKHMSSEKRSHYYNDKSNEMPFVCPICKVHFYDEKLFYAHCLNGNICNICFECAIAFKTKKALLDHWEILHSNVITIKCGLCHNQHNNQLSLASIPGHLKKGHSKNMVSCLVCQVDTRAELFQHYGKKHLSYCVTANKLGEMECPICSSEFKSKKNLINHLSKELDDANFNYHQCKHCLSYFCSKQNLVWHLLHKNCCS